MTSSVANVCTALGIPGKFLSVIAEDWDAAMAEIPPAGTWMEAGTVEALCAYGRLDEAGTACALETAREIQVAEPRRCFAWVCHWRLLNKGWPRFQSWPGEEDAKGVGRLYLLAALSVIPKIREAYTAKGIPETITRDTTLRIADFSGNHVVAHGMPGILNAQLHWMRRHVVAEVFRLVRLEFIVGSAGTFGTALRNRKTGEVVLMAPDGIAYDRNGFVDGVGKGIDEKGWKSSFMMEGGRYRGTPISPLGCALSSGVSLAAADWVPEFSSGDMALDMHIPPGGSMTLDLCRESLVKAFEFFARFFPDKPVNAVISRSWIFNTQFEEMLPESNVARFMRELYLFPVESTGSDGFFFIFYKDYPDLSKAPRRTSMQKAMLEVLERGGRLRSGGMFLLKRDIEFFGTQFYRRTTRVTQGHHHEQNH